MPKDRKAPPLSSDHSKASPYCCSTKNTEKEHSRKIRGINWEQEGMGRSYIGKINGWIDIKPARRFMNSKPRSCSHEACEFSGTYSSLEKHARLVHPLVQPSKADPIRQQNWTELGRERQTQDLLSASQREWEEEGSDPMTLEGGFGDSENEVSFVSMERSSSPVNSLQQTTASGGSGVVGRSRRFRTTPRMRVGNGPWHQLASRTGGYPPRQTQNIIGQI
ncbi:hypothetical protein Acr_11g0012970 [Actinidia rufa]|uniref:Uncharacterized protein n=1 Tax=Actinidia rufa TaxID=165716 RepID=A0A7J0FE81_9ERIC|nr:hypothetical protein Acr_11g0012970 [Actinidia rufa]